MISLPAVISDGMVIEKKARLWGWTQPNRAVTVRFRGREMETVANGQGRFTFDLLSDAYGGSDDLTIGDITIHRVTVGRVWFCGGQSNMELPVSRVRRAFEDSLRRVNHPHIRAYIADKAYDFNQARQVGGGRWISATPEQLDLFYATAYFFAEALYAAHGIPIGLLCCAAGGATAESWMRAEALALFEKPYALCRVYQNAAYVRETEKADAEAVARWHTALDQADIGLAGGWEKEDYDDSAWKERPLTAPWAADLRLNGAVWFRAAVDIPEAMAGQPATLWLGRITDTEYVYVNGRFAGRVEYQYPPRIFPLPPGLLTQGRNVIAVRVISQRGVGGFDPAKDYQITAGTERVPLNGVWKYRIGAVMPPMPETTFFMEKPTGLYNAMLSPLVGYGITGAIWYQGESNTHEPSTYHALMRALIDDWRTGWGTAFPFIFTQLANFEAHSAPRPHSLWAELREQQRQCLSIPHTAMAVTADCGEYHDLHPLDKKTVGERLALAARHMAYGEDIIYSGPLVIRVAEEGTHVEDGHPAEAEPHAVFTHPAAGSRLVVYFDHADGGLSTPDGMPPGGFEIETADGQRFLAEAFIEGETVVIPTGGRPVACLYYMWADAPSDAFIYNRAGLPASPFRWRLYRHA